MPELEDVLNEKIEKEQDSNYWQVQAKHFANELNSTRIYVTELKKSFDRIDKRIDQLLDIIEYLMNRGE